MCKLPKESCTVRKKNTLQCSMLHILFGILCSFNEKLWCISFCCPIENNALLLFQCSTLYNNFSFFIRHLNTPSNITVHDFVVFLPNKKATPEFKIQMKSIWHINKNLSHLFAFIKEVSNPAEIILNCAIFFLGV